MMCQAWNLMRLLLLAIVLHLLLVTCDQSRVREETLSPTNGNPTAPTKQSQSSVDLDQPIKSITTDHPTLNVINEMPDEHAVLSTPPISTQNVSEAQITHENSSISITDMPEFGQNLDIKGFNSSDDKSDQSLDTTEHPNLDVINEMPDFQNNVTQPPIEHAVLSIPPISTQNVSEAQITLHENSSISIKDMPEFGQNLDMKGLNSSDDRSDQLFDMAAEKNETSGINHDTVVLTGDDEFSINNHDKENIAMSDGQFDVQPDSKMNYTGAIQSSYTTQSLTKKISKQKTDEVVNQNISLKPFDDVSFEINESLSNSNVPQTKINDRDQFNLTDQEVIPNVIFDDNLNNKDENSTLSLVTKYTTNSVTVNDTSFDVMKSIEDDSSDYSVQITEYFSQHTTMYNNQDLINEVDPDIPGEIDQGMFYEKEIEFIERDNEDNDDFLSTWHAITFFLVVTLGIVVVYVIYTRVNRRMRANYAYSKLGNQRDEFEFEPLV